MIYVRIDGRIGNQLFMYAYAKRLSKELDDNNIVIDDTEVLKRGYKNSLVDYDLKNVIYVHNHKMMYKLRMLKKTLIFDYYRVVRKNKSYLERFEYEKKKQSFFNKNGLFLCGMGYLPHDLKKGQDVFINGYFQSDKYFDLVKEELKEELLLPGSKSVNNYPNIDKIRKRNTVCISIKVQHNVGNDKFDVCNDGYWQNAIQYMCSKVENPLFFVCSDDVDYVRKNLLDCSKYDVVFQDSRYPVTVSLAVMANCKHFIIGNTTYGWWAQYLSKNKEKIVVAPSRWVNVEMPDEDIYQPNWHLLEV